MVHYSSQEEIRDLEEIINRRFGHYFRDDFQQIEYKPLDAIHLLEMPAAYLEEVRDR